MERKEERHPDAGRRGPHGAVHVAEVARAERPLREHEVALVDQTRERRGGARRARRHGRVQRRRRRRRAAVTRAVAARRADAAEAEARRPRQVRSGHLRATNGTTLKIVECKFRQTIIVVCCSRVTAADTCLYS